MSTTSRPGRFSLAVLFESTLSAPAIDVSPTNPGAPKVAVIPLRPLPTRHSAHKAKPSRQDSLPIAA